VWIHNAHFWVMVSSNLVEGHQHFKRRAVFEHWGNTWETWGTRADTGASMSLEPGLIILT